MKPCHFTVFHFLLRPAGGIIQRLFVIDAHGDTDDIVLGHDALSDYLVRDSRKLGEGLVTLVFEQLLLLYTETWQHAPGSEQYSALSTWCAVKSRRADCDCYLSTISWCRVSISTLARLSAGSQIALLWGQ